MPKAVASVEEMDVELKAAKTKAVVVDFHATWCGPCKVIAPKLEEFEKLYPNVIILKVDVDEAEELAVKYEVSAMPTFICIKNGEVVDTVIGADPVKVEELFKKYGSITGECEPDVAPAPPK
jgi:thioredoxin 1